MMMTNPQLFSTSVLVSIMNTHVLMSILYDIVVYHHALNIMETIVQNLIAV